MYKPEPGHEEASVKPQMRTVLFIFKSVCVCVCIGVIFFRNMNAIKNKRMKRKKEGPKKERKERTR